MLERMWRNRNTSTLLVGVKISTTIVEDRWRFLKNLEIEIPLDPAIPLLGIYPKDYKLFYYKDTCTHIFTEALFTIAKTWNQSKSPLMIDWIGKMWHMEYYVAIKNYEFVSFIGTWMNLKTIILSKLTQLQKIEHCMFSLKGGCRTMRTHGHREGSITHWGLLEGIGEAQHGVRRLGRDNMGRNARYR